MPIVRAKEGLEIFELMILAKSVGFYMIYLESILWSTDFAGSLVCGLEDDFSTASAGVGWKMQKSRLDPLEYQTPCFPHKNHILDSILSHICINNFVGKISRHGGRS